MDGTRNPGPGAAGSLPARTTEARTRVPVHSLGPWEIGAWNLLVSCILSIRPRPAHRASRSSAKEIVPYPVPRTSAAGSCRLAHEPDSKPVPRPQPAQNQESNRETVSRDVPNANAILQPRNSIAPKPIHNGNRLRAHVRTLIHDGNPVDAPRPTRFQDGNRFRAVSRSHCTTEIRSVPLPGGPRNFEIA